jgi:hypothetical protein
LLVRAKFLALNYSSKFVVSGLRAFLPRTLNVKGHDIDSLPPPGLRPLDRVLSHSPASGPNMRRWRAHICTSPTT